MLWDDLVKVVPPKKYRMLSLMCTTEAIPSQKGHNAVNDHITIGALDAGILGGPNIALRTSATLLVTGALLVVTRSY